MTQASLLFLTILTVVLQCIACALPDLSASSDPCILSPSQDGPLVLVKSLPIDLWLAPKLAETLVVIDLDPSPRHAREFTIVDRAVSAKPSSSVKASSSTKASSSSTKASSSSTKASSSSTKASSSPTKAPSSSSRTKVSSTSKPSSTKASSKKASSTKASSSTSVKLFASATPPKVANAVPSDITAYLLAHNTVRALHKASALTWNDTLASAAQTWVDKCLFVHSLGILGPWGENMAVGTGPSYGFTSSMTVWTAEMAHYNGLNPQPSHFTQVVWKGTTQVGCALQPSCTGIFSPLYGLEKFYVCEYYPRGNLVGQFGSNVLF